MQIYVPTPFPQLFLDWKAESIKLFTFWMYDASSQFFQFSETPNISGFYLPYPWSLFCNQLHQLHPTILPSKYIVFMYYICIYVFYVDLNQGKTRCSDGILVGIKIINHVPASHRGQRPKGLLSPSVHSFMSRRIRRSIQRMPSLITEGLRE